MSRGVRLRGPVYMAELRPARGFSLEDTMKTYSFGWMYRGGGGGLIELCPGAVAEVEESGGVVVARVYAEAGCWEEEADAIERMLGLREDYTAYHEIGRGDPLVGGVVESMPGHRLRSTSIWAALLIAVCQQNTGFKQGWWMLYRLHLNASRRLILPDGRVYLETPSPERLTREALRASGLGYRAETVARLIEARAWEKSCREVEELAEVRGVGGYTLNLVKLLACRDYSATPLDRWVKRLAAEAYGDWRGLLRKFGPWAGLAAHHATIGFDAEPLRRALERLRRGLNRPGLSDPSPVTLWRHTPPPPLV